VALVTFFYARLFYYSITNNPTRIAAMTTNNGPEAMRLAQLYWKQDQQIRAAGGRPVYGSWADTLRGAWLQVRALGGSTTASAKLRTVISYLINGSPSVAAQVAKGLVSQHWESLYSATRVRLIGVIHQQQTGRHNPAIYH